MECFVVLWTVQSVHMTIAKGVRIWASIEHVFLTSISSKWGCAARTYICLQALCYFGWFIDKNWSGYVTLASQCAEARPARRKNSLCEIFEKCPFLNFKSWVLFTFIIILLLSFKKYRYEDIQGHLTVRNDLEGTIWCTPQSPSFMQVGAQNEC